MGERDVAGSRLPPLSRATAAVAAAAASWALSVVAASCSPADGGGDVRVSVRDSAGITTVESPGGDRPFGAVTVRIADLVPPDSALLAVPWGVAADPMAGRIYVADPLGERVVVFDRSGEYVDTFGRAGEAPGEFRRPSALALDPHGAPTVWDAGRGVLSRWSSEGDLLNEQRPGVSYWGPGFALAPGALFTVTSTTTSSGMVMEQRLVAMTPRGTETVHAVPRELAMMELPCATMRRVPRLSVVPRDGRAPPGRFLMGAPEGEAAAAEIPSRPEWTERAEKPPVEVRIDHRLAIGKYEVTFAEWDRCVEAGGCDYRPDDEGWGRGDRPVLHVARTDARRYVEWLREVTEKPCRLPSEAEWEYAARAGTSTARWWGDEIGRGRAVCDGCGSRWDERSTAPVGSLPANPWGLHDMLGNVAEWVADCWHPTNEGNAGDGSARIETSPWWRAEGWKDRRGEPCQRLTQRGGTYSSYRWAVRAAWRDYYWPAPTWTERKSETQGFRVARTMSAGRVASDVPPSDPEEPGSTGLERASP